MGSRRGVRSLVAAATALALAFGVAPAVPALSSAAAAPRAPQFEITAVGGDVSWPQCPKSVGLPGRRGLGLPLPATTAGFMVVGLTNGVGFTVNPCIDRQVAYATRHRIPMAVYALATYPTTWQLSHFGWSGPFPTGSLAGRLSNTGYAEATHTLATMQRSAIASPIVWVDIESSRSRPWSKYKARNNAVVAGMVQAYTDAGYQVGFYSTSYQWNRILGRSALRGYPEWRTVGGRGKAAALRQCSTGSFQGGPAVLSQWWTRSRDHDLLCAQYRSADQTGAWFAIQGEVPQPTPTDTPVPGPTDTAVPVPTDTTVPVPTDVPLPGPTDVVPTPTDVTVPAPSDPAVPVPAPPTPVATVPAG